MSWRIDEQVPTLAVGDLESALAFYRRLGFALEWQWPRDLPTHAGLRRDSSVLMLKVEAGWERSQIYFVVSDVLSCFKDIHQHRPWQLEQEELDSDAPSQGWGQAPAPPSVKAHGHLDFTLTDPFGNQLTFGCEAVSG